MAQSVQARSSGRTYTDIVLCSIFTHNVGAVWTVEAQGLFSVKAQPACAPALCLQDHGIALQAELNVQHKHYESTQHGLPAVTASASMVLSHILESETSLLASHNDMG